MSRYINAEKLKKIVEQAKQRALKGAEVDEDLYCDGRADAFGEVLLEITSLQQEPHFPQYDNIVEKVFGAGNLEGWERDEAEMLVALAKEELLKSLQQKQPDYKEAIQLVFEEELTPFKDGNQWCFLLGGNIQEGICGFGDTILDAAVAFYKDYTNTKIHIGELKMTQQQPEVDIEKEIDKHAENMPHGEFTPDSECEEHEEWAKREFHHFYELGLKARKEK